MTQHKLTLDQPATYEIMVPGQIDGSWSDWVEGTIVTYTCVDNLSLTTLKCTVDQAALLGLLRRLYAIGLPLISVVCVERAPYNENDSRSLTK